MINSGLTLHKHSHRSKEMKRMPTHHYYFPTASVKSKKYGYRKDTQFLLFSGDVTMFLKKRSKRRVWKPIRTDQFSKEAQIQTKQTEGQSDHIVRNITVESLCCVPDLI